MASEKTINKTMELSDLDSEGAKKIVAELNDLIIDLKKKQLKISSWYGHLDDADSFERINRGYNYVPLDGAADDKNFPWFLYWEIVWVTLNSEFNKGQKVLDLGGSSSLFSYYLASKGLDVVTVDLQQQLVENADHVARRMGWKLKNYVMDMTQLDFNFQFDHITSICVYEHMPIHDRVQINGRIQRLLRRDGRFSITFDYRNPSRRASISTPDDVYEQFVKPSGLTIRSNREFVDTQRSYLIHPFYYPGISLRYKMSQIVRGHFRPWEITKSKPSNDYTFGALFQEKR